MTEQSEQSELDLRKHNIMVLRAATEDVNHGNNARMALLRDNHGVEVTAAELISHKINFILSLMAGGDELVMRDLEFRYQQYLAERISEIEHEAWHRDGADHDHERED